MLLLSAYNNSVLCDISTTAQLVAFFLLSCICGCYSMSCFVRVVYRSLYTLPVTIPLKKVLASQCKCIQVVLGDQKWMLELPAIEVTEHCELTYGCWELNPGPLVKQPVL